MPAKFVIDVEPQDNFGGRSKIRFGVGEVLGLDALETPKVKPPTPVECVIKSGSAVVKPSQVMGSFVVTCGNKPGPVVIEVRTKQDKKVVATKRFEVVAPSGFETRVVSRFSGPKQYGFEINQSLTPLDVSFRWVDIRETAAPYEGTGCWQRLQINPIGDGTFDGVDAIHPVRNDWIDCDGGKNKNDIGNDEINQWWPRKWAPGGTFKWVIPQYYRVRGMAGEFKFATGVHQAAISASGELKIGKFGVSHKVQLPPSQ
jgi:hypothetical protein